MGLNSFKYIKLLRIYLEHFNYQNINFNNLNKCNKEERNQIEIYSDEGIYLIEKIIDYIN